MSKCTQSVAFSTGGSAGTKPGNPLENSGQAFKYSRNLTGAMAALVVCIGMAMCFMLPVLNVPDEIYHWQRAVQVSHGQFFADRREGQDYGGEIDIAALEFARWANSQFEHSSAFSLTQARQVSAALAKSGGMVRASFPSSASFSPLAYLPQAFGIAVARQLGGRGV